jgi:hypothetical protein
MKVLCRTSAFCLTMATSIKVIAGNGNVTATGENSDGC